MRASLSSAAALIRADLAAGRRALGTGRVAVLTSSTGSALLVALLALGAVALAVAVHGLAVGGSPDAAAGAVDLLLAAAFAAGLVSPTAGGPTTRITALARATAAPVDARVALIAAAAREALAAPVGPAIVLSAGAACGLGAAHGVAVAMLALVLATALSVVALVAGVMFALLTAHRRGAGLFRTAIIAATLVSIGSLSRGVPANAESGLADALAALHRGHEGAALLPSRWLVAPLDAAGLLTWWPLVVAPALVAWVVWNAPGLLATAWPPVDARAHPGRVRPLLRLDLRGPLGGRLGEWLGALLAKDVALLLRERGLHILVLRHAALALAPLAAVAAAAWFARGDATSAARLARALPALALAAHLVVVAQSGLATRMAGTDGGGAAHVLSLPVRELEFVASKAIAWALLFAPLLGVATAAAVLMAGLASGASDVAALTVRAGIEGVAAGCAGTGAGIVTATIWPGRSTASNGGTPSARTGLAGLVGGVGAAGLALGATLPVAYAFHGLRGTAGVTLGCVLGLAALGLGIGLGASLLRARRERFLRALACASPGA